MTPSRCMREAIRLSERALHSGAGGPFGAVVVLRGRIIGRGHNLVLKTNDPTAHAEIVAIRDAARRQKAFWLEGADLYTSCEPCPMCLAAAYWARLRRVYFANTRVDAAAIGFADAELYEQVALPPARRRMAMKQLLRREAQAAFQSWLGRSAGVRY